MRPSNRNPDQLRPLDFICDFTQHAEGSVLVKHGNTQVLCTASVIDGVPRFLRDKKQGWLTAEYGMLPRATHSRNDREAARGKQAGRTQEIQRLIGRSLRNCVDLTKLGDTTIIIDCDVIQADGGTRVAAINGGCVALVKAIQHLQYRKKLKHDPLKHLIGAVSVGIHQGQAVLDFDYAEDADADSDMNVVMTEQGEFIEIQGTAEQQAFNGEQLNAMLALAQQGIADIIERQKAALK